MDKLAPIEGAFLSQSPWLHLLKQFQLYGMLVYNIVVFYIPNMDMCRGQLLICFPCQHGTRLVGGGGGGGAG